jgi:hypothetical protein
MAIRRAFLDGNLVLPVPYILHRFHLPITLEQDLPKTMAKCKVTLYVDIVSPFGYMAYYMLQVSRILGQCPLFPSMPSGIILSFHPQAAPKFLYVGVYSEPLFVLVRHIGLSLVLS